MLDFYKKFLNVYLPVSYEVLIAEPTLLLVVDYLNTPENKEYKDKLKTLNIYNNDEYLFFFKNNILSHERELKAVLLFKKEEFQQHVRSCITG